VAVSPDGTSVYVAAVGDGGISIFNRAANGTLTAAGCISKAALAGCNTNGGGALAGAAWVAVSPDGANVYVVAEEDNAISTFSRATNGALTGAGCISQAPLAGCTTPGGGVALDTASGVDVSPDGTSVIATSFGNDAISVFNREVPPAPAVSPPAPVVPITPVSGPTGKRAGALRRCEKKHKEALERKREHNSLTKPVKKHLQRKFKRCEKKARRLPV
jgi:DNA-binding beta-propeller fold protein YncE